MATLRRWTTSIERRVLYGRPSARRLSCRPGAGWVIALSVSRRRYICAWSNVQAICGLDPAAVGALHYHYQFPRQANNHPVFAGSWRAAPTSVGKRKAAARCWSCRPDVATRGFALLQAAGVPRGAWFVPLHVRNCTSPGKFSMAACQAIGNADAAAYLPAITGIAHRSGYGVRMGDPDAPPMPARANIIDYCRSDMAFGLDGYFPDRAKPLHAWLGIRTELRAAALWRAGGADQLVAAGHAAMARGEHCSCRNCSGGRRMDAV